MVWTPTFSVIPSGVSYVLDPFRQYTGYDIANHYCYAPIVTALNSSLDNCKKNWINPHNASSSDYAYRLPWQALLLADIVRIALEKHNYLVACYTARAASSFVNDAASNDTKILREY